MDAFTQRGVVSFLMWALASFVCFVVASLVARQFSSSVRRAYWMRLTLMLVLLIVWWGLFFPAIIPTREEREHHLRSRTVAAQYGMHTIWIWCAVAAVNRPKEKKGQDEC